MSLKMQEDTAKREETRASLTRLQKFDASTLARQADLGTLNFSAAVVPARRLIELFQKVPPEMLSDLPDAQLSEILNASNSTYQLFNQVLEFNLSQANPGETRDNLVRSIESHYANAFARLAPWISYGVARTVDFNNLAAEGRAAVQAIADRGAEMEKRFSAHEETARNLEDQLRSALAKQGVGTQAQYFQEEANIHAQQAKIWGDRTWRWAILVALFAILSFFIYRVPFLAPQTTTEAIQLVASKVLLFGVLTFMLVRSARNYAAHKHNEVVNRHKQNSLLTFNALVEASATSEARNTVLNHAAASIYAVPDTGYVRGGADHAPNVTTLVELLPRGPQA